MSQRSAPQDHDVSPLTPRHPVIVRSPTPGSQPPESSASHLPLVPDQFRSRFPDLFPDRFEDATRPRQIGSSELPVSILFPVETLTNYQREVDRGIFAPLRTTEIEIRWDMSFKDLQQQMFQYHSQHDGGVDLTRSLTWKTSLRYGRGGRLEIDEENWPGVRESILRSGQSESTSRMDPRSVPEAIESVSNEMTREEWIRFVPTFMTHYTPEEQGRGEGVQPLLDLGMGHFFHWIPLSESERRAREEWERREGLRLAELVRQQEQQWQQEQQERERRNQRGRFKTGLDKLLHRNRES